MVVGMLVGKYPDFVPRHLAEKVVNEIRVGKVLVRCDATNPDFLLHFQVAIPLFYDKLPAGRDILLDRPIVFTIFSGHRGHNDEDIHRAQTYIEGEFKADISVDQIAGRVNMSKRNFIRRFKSATSLNPIEYIQRIKIEAAKKSLEAGESNIAYVTYDVGYNDLKTFRTIFKRITGLTPIEYRNRYNTETLLR